MDAILEAILDTTEDGISVISRDHEIIRANKRIFDIFGQKYPLENQNKKCFHVYWQRDAMCDKCPAADTFEQGVPRQIIRVIRDTSIKKIVLTQATFPVKDADGAVTHVIECFKDITSVVELENQLFTSERLAGLGKVAAGLAHEIRNPLGSIKATAQYCLGKYELQDAMSRHLKLIIKSSDRVNKVMNDLLHLAQPREASFKADSVAKVVNSICGLVHAKCVKQRVRVAKRLPKRLPPVLMDVKILEEAFLNFVLNAIEAMPSGGRLAIIAGYAPLAHEITISFIDSGKGISEDHIDKVFDPFFTMKKDGTGLGLSLARQIIKIHGGDIHIKSKPNYGTEVTVFLPEYRVKDEVHSK